MNLVISTVAVAPGPDWANNTNADLSIIDGHDHSVGKGVQISPAGLNISSDLPFLGNNATGLRSVRFNPQGSPISGVADLGALSVSGVDLYYNDVSGNQIRITASGGVAGSPGSIGSLTPPASVTYVSGNQTFVFQSNVNTPANLDGGSVILRNITANSKGLTLSPPNAMGADYAITLPALPATTSYVTIDNAGSEGTVSVALLAQSLIHTGSMVPHAPSTIPAGFLLADGSAVSRTTYAALFAAIGVTYGAGNGSTTFNVPNATGLLSVPVADTTNIPAYVHSYWHMDGTTSEPNVIQPNSYNLNESGFVGVGQGLLNNARGPFSANDLLSLTEVGTPYDNQTTMIDGYFKTSSSADQVIIDHSNDANAGWLVRMIAGRIEGIFFGITGLQSVLTYNDDVWHYFNLAKVGSSGAGEVRLYVDNSVVSTTGSVYNPYTSGLMAVGRYVTTASSPWLGLLDDISISSASPATISDTDTIAAFRYNGGAGNLFFLNTYLDVNYIIKT